ncbi:hypothetical protein [Paludibacterium paludis]|uniref:Uncharacterized protein n=1 Tax=Paludibacterium paludis TaxID=1225769 RepID=A0A918NZG1_9NEIS|nr:hypothetical protein [Paludibacterium paludis]GGY07769.1 hypothetical protein GCM10011289_07870 [Paludibacterium paludis]
MKRTMTLIATVFAFSSLAHAGDGFLNVQKMQAEKAEKQVRTDIRSGDDANREAQRQAADRKAGEAIEANRDNYRTK